MVSTSFTRVRLTFLTTVCSSIIGWCLCAPFVFANAGSMTFTVTPPLFQIAIAPGETWSSEITVVNSNPYDMSVYAEPVGFEPTGETGRPRFLYAEQRATSGAPVFERNVSAGWISVPVEGALVARERTLTIPFTLTVPSDAPPGGHYAAILIGNREPDDAVREEGAVAVTSAIASLLFIRVTGDVVEHGRIRELSTERSVYERAEARLSLRFENLGNVHLQPQGAITIYNMFGKKRGEIAVNQSGSFGNVLPGSVRSFAFTWDSDAGLWDIGRYRADVTLGYGFESKQFAHATTYFWVLPLVPLAQVLVGVFLTFHFLAWAIRAYIRRALALERVSVQGSEALGDTGNAYAAARPVEQPSALRLRTLVRPLSTGMVDLRRVHVASRSSNEILENATDSPQSHMDMRTFFRTYRAFFFFIVAGLLCALGVGAYFSDVLTAERPFRATEERVMGGSEAGDMQVE